MWLQIYEKLFGGFEDLNDMAKEDMDEEDELDNISCRYENESRIFKRWIL